MALNCKQFFPLKNTKLAEALATHLRRVLRCGPDRYKGGFHAEIKRRVVIRNGDLHLYYSQDNEDLRAWVSERVAGFRVGWTVAKKGLKWA